MRKPLIASATTCLLALGCITGCGDQPSDAKVAEDLDALLYRMSTLETPLARFPENKKLYAGTGPNAEISREAEYIDQAVALLPAAQSIAANGNDQQKSTANAIIATILTDEAAYLIGVAQTGYQQQVLKMVGYKEKIREGTEQEKTIYIAGLYDRIDLLREINQINQALAGDRSEIIDTIRTGKVDDNTTVQGIEQLSAQAQEADATATAINGKIRDLNNQIKQLQEDVAEYENLELKLSNEALSAQGKTHFDKLDQATTAAYEAETAASKAEALALNVALQTYRAEIAEGRSERNAAVVAELKAKVQQVEDEKKQIADRLAALENDRKKTVQALTAAFDQLNAEMKARGFDRMALAHQKLKEADTALKNAGLGSSAQLKQMGIYLLQARSLHQQALAASSYAALLESLAASGSDTLGKGLHDAMTARIRQMKEMDEAIAKQAAELKTQAEPTLSAIEGGADPSTDEGKATMQKTRVFRGLLATAM